MDVADECMRQGCETSTAVTFDLIAFTPNVQSMQFYGRAAMQSLGRFLLHASKPICTTHTCSRMLDSMTQSLKAAQSAKGVSSIGIKLPVRYVHVSAQAQAWHAVRLLQAHMHVQGLLLYASVQ
jgi:hypothetical protein